jgi:chromosome segregation ATPase
MVILSILKSWRIRMSERQTLTWQACDALAAENKKPSIGLVRAWTLQHAGAKRGSDPDVQADINAWYANLFKLRIEKAIPELPDPIATLMRQLWKATLEAANVSLGDERDALAKEKREIEQRIEQAQTDAVAAIESAKEASGKLAIAQETIAGRDKEIQRLEAALAEIQALDRAKDERIAGMLADFARKEADYAARVAELDGLRKRALLDIEAAREETRRYKAERDQVSDKIEAYRQQAVKLENSLAELRGGHAATEKALSAAQQRIQQLEAELSAAKVKVIEAATEKRLALSTNRIGVNKRRVLEPVRRRKL